MPNVQIPDLSWKNVSGWREWAVAKDWTTEAGLRAAIIATHRTVPDEEHEKIFSFLDYKEQELWFNGYVAVDVTHPFYGLGYSDEIELTQAEVDEIEQELQGEIDVRGPITLLISALHSMNKEAEDVEATVHSTLVKTRIDFLINVHGGLTYGPEGETSGDYPVPHGAKSWFGFDTCHHGDYNLPMSYCEEQTESMAKQLTTVARVVKRRLKP